MSVNLTHTAPTDFTAHERLFSQCRMATYLTESKGNPVLAADLYRWNASMSAAFYEVLQVIEVAVRNAMDRELAMKYGPDWYDSLRFRLDIGTNKKIADAKQGLLQKKRPVTPPDVVAALSFGFWVGLLGKGGKISPSGTTGANYTQLLWVPCFVNSFPMAKKQRGNVHQPLDYLRTFRNRIAHHEPIFFRHLAKDYAQILQVADWIDPSVTACVLELSRIPATLLQDPRKKRFFLMSNGTGI